MGSWLDRIGASLARKFYEGSNPFGSTRILDPTNLCEASIGSKHHAVTVVPCGFDSRRTAQLVTST